MNSKRKGNNGERELCQYLNDHGIPAHRNDQRCILGGLDNPDISIDGYHVEVKRTEQFRLYDAMNQAIRDANGHAVPVVVHRRNKSGWVAVLRIDDFIRLLK